MTTQGSEDMLMNSTVKYGSLTLVLSVALQDGKENSAPVLAIRRRERV